MKINSKDNKEQERIITEEIRLALKYKGNVHKGNDEIISVDFDALLKRSSTEKTGLTQLLEDATDLKEKVVLEEEQQQSEFKNKMIETVENRDELIKYSFNIIWKATEGKITNATFNTNPLFSVSFFLNDETSETLHLDAPNVVLIKRENFLKVLNLTEQNEVPIIIDDEINSNIENLKKDQGSEFQDLDPVTYS
ncbi:198_t:CDS:2, partial [Dentiscutata heterogama]